MKTSSFLLALIGVGAFSLTFGGMSASPGTFQLQMRNSMVGTNANMGPLGWAEGRYSLHSGTTNQILQLNCRGLATNQVYHLMASWETNGELIHVADFTPGHTGGILMQFSGGLPHHFVGTNNPGQAWGVMGGWTNHMSWVVFPAGTNWASVDTGMPMRDGVAMIANGMGGMMGGPGTNGMGGMGGHWPQMTNWWTYMTNWPTEMADWSWNYTNMWNPADNYGGPSTNWWGSLGPGASHMMPLPESIDSVPGINGLVVMDQNLQPVLVCDLANPDAYAYDVSCNFTNEGAIPGASGSLRVAETQRAAHFTMTASGLAASTRYFLSVNNANLIPVSTDSRGRLRLRSLPEGVTTMRGVGSLSIEDEAGNAILSAVLPPG